MVPEGPRGVLETTPRLLRLTFAGRRPARHVTSRHVHWKRDICICSTKNPPAAPRRLAYISRGFDARLVYLTVRQHMQIAVHASLLYSLRSLTKFYWKAILQTLVFITDTQDQKPWGRTAMKLIPGADSQSFTAA